MPKMKTKSAAKKRFEKKKSKKIKVARAGKRHLLTKKTSKRKRHLRKEHYVCHADIKALQRMLPY